MRILVDTSVWVEHLRRPETSLVELLGQDDVLIHPWVRGELALGFFQNRADFLLMLSFLPALTVEPDTKVFELLEECQLFNQGIGWVDAQLLAACLARPCRLWTKDKRLAALAAALRIGWEPNSPIRGNFSLPGDDQ